MITRYLYQNPRIVWLIIVTILVAGVSCLAVMPRLEDPILKRRVAVITAELHGAGPVEIESSITVPIERWLNEFSEIKQVRTNTRANVASIVVELKDRVDDPTRVWTSIKSKLSDNASQLPDGCTELELNVFPLKAFAAILAIVPETNRGPNPFQHRRLARELCKTILNLDATESVELFGDSGEEITVSVTPTTLASLGASVGAIAQQIAEGKAVPAGNSEQEGMQVMIQVEEPGQLVQQIENTFIRSPKILEPVQISDIARVAKRTPVPQTTAAIINGKQSIVLGVMVDNDARVDLWAERLDRAIDQFETEFADEYAVVPLFKQSEHIHQRMLILLRNLGISTAAVAAIVFLLMGWRCMIVVTISLPLSACLVMCGLRMMSIPIHQISITGLIVALGLLIDNSIVIVEEVRSRIFGGNKPLTAMLDAVRHLRVPLLGSTLTTILAFLPIATMPGPSGEFVGSLAVSVILAIGASFLLAMTVIPQLVSVVGVSARRQGVFEYGIRLSPLTWLYRQTLRMTFRWPILGVLVGVALPVLGFYSAQHLEKEFFPASDRAQIQIELELPASGTLDAVRESTKRVTSIVAKDNRVLRQHWFLGQSAPTFFYNVVPRRRNSPYYAQAFVDIEADSNIDELVNDLQAQIDSQVLDARVLVRKLEQGPPFDAPVEVRIFGDDLAQLQDIGNQIRTMLSENVYVTHTRSDLGSSIPKLSLNLDQGLMRETQLTPKEVSKFLYTCLEGAKAGSFFDQGEQIPVHVRVDYSNRSIVETLSAMTIASPKQAVPTPQNLGNPSGQIKRVAASAPLLGNFGDFQLKSDVGAIIRIDGQRVNEVKAYLQAGALPSAVTDEIKKTLQQSEFALPGNYRLEFGGETEKRTQAIAALIVNAVVLFSIMLLTLVATLGSFRSAFVIASVGGLAIGLAPLALYWFEFPFGFMAIVGTMGLIGVAINDSIVVLAAIRANDNIRESSLLNDEPSNDATAVPQLGESEQPKSLEDVVIGCTRHILTTTFTTMIGFLPLVIYGGKFWPPLAIVVSAGVFGATLIALYFVPSVNLLFQARKSVRGPFRT